MNREQVLAILNRLGVIINNNHFVYTSGKHGSDYLNKDAVTPHTQDLSRLCHAIAERFVDTNVEVVIGPAVVGSIIASWVAHHLSELTGHEVLAVFADKADGDTFVIKRGFDKILQGRRVLGVEDILNTGGSAKKVIDLLPPLECHVIGLGAFCNRGRATAESLGVPTVETLIDFDLDAWPAQGCRLCEAGVPVNTEFGHGAKFLAEQTKA